MLGIRLFPEAGEALVRGVARADAEDQASPGGVVQRDGLLASFQACGAAGA